MGTRGLLGLVTKGKRHGAYNQYDSYPSGLGQSIVDFILSLDSEELAEMLRLVGEITWVDEGAVPTREQQEQYSKLGFSDLTVAEQSLDSWYCLLRNLQGAKALPEIKKGQLKHLVDSVDFLQDGLFCEWAYFIDFEKETLETWRHGQLLETTTFKDLRESQTTRQYMAFIEEEYEPQEGDEDADESDEAVSDSAVEDLD